MALETFSNNGQTLLNGSIDNSQTTITIDDSSTFPPHSTGKFRIKIDDELIRCEVNSATSTELINCERGIEGSTAAAHADNTPLTHVLTAGALQEITQVQMSITRDDDGIKLDGDTSSPSNYNFYAVDGSGNRGWINLNTNDSVQWTSGTLSLVGDTTTPGNNKVYGTDGSGTRGWYDPSATVNLNDIGDATGNTAIDFGSYNFQLTGQSETILDVTDSGTVCYVTLDGENVFIKGNAVTIGEYGNTLGFFGTAGITQPDVVSLSSMACGDGEIGGVSISDPPTQSEVQSLRDQCEDLRDDVAAIHTMVSDMRDALYQLGLITNA